MLPTQSQLERRAPKSTKRYILSDKNIRYAVRKSYSAKSTKQREKAEVKEVMADVNAFSAKYYNELCDGTYQVGPYRHFDLFDRKHRHISVLKYTDRCMQFHFKLAIEPVLLKAMTDDMFGGLPGRGIVTKPWHPSMIRRIRALLTSGKYNYIWLGDISKFYDSLKNAIIMREIERWIKDPFTLALLRQHIYNLDTLAIGDPLSHLLANLVMSCLVRYIKETYPDCAVVNFADNIMVLADTQERCQQIMRAAHSFASTRLRLHFHKGEHVEPIQPGVGIHFCGRIYYTSGKVLLRKGTKENIARKRHKPLSMASYKGILQSCNCKHLVKVLQAS